MLTSIFVLSTLFWGGVIYLIDDEWDDDDDDHDNHNDDGRDADFEVAEVSEPLSLSIQSIALGEDADMDEPVTQGGPEADKLTGDDGDDVLLGEEGDDILRGRDGDDLILGGEGDDILFGERGDDLAIGGEGNDLVAGGAGDDQLIGGEGEDVITGGSGEDILIGGNGVVAEMTDDQQDGSGKDADRTLPPVTGAGLEDDGEADDLRGEVGADALVLGAEDTGTGGSGADDFFVLLDQAPKGPAIIADYEDTSDQILILPDNPDADPVISVVPTGEDALVLADGVVLAVVVGAGASLSASDVIIATAPAG